MTWACLNGRNEPAIPNEVVASVIQEWCRVNRLEDEIIPETPEDFSHVRSCSISHPYTRLASMSGINDRVMHNLYYGKARDGGRGKGRAMTVSLGMMDRIVTHGMEEPWRWHEEPLARYYSPLEEQGEQPAEGQAEQRKVSILRLLSQKPMTDREIGLELGVNNDLLMQRRELVLEGLVVEAGVKQSDRKRPAKVWAVV